MSNSRIAEASLKAGTRFPVNRQDHTQKGKYFKPAFERLLKEKYPMQLPTGELAKMQGFKGVALAVIWEALRGDIAAAREIMDRVDGKLSIDGNGNKVNITQVNYILGNNEYLSPFKNRILENANSDS